ncbi:hypothetical protein HPB50_016967 [Hyalomma asiaticum]|uniref:Uncharacterized protein n=1 Tax=Hyalomma asiaticum TaxID=266040 RepID=A0ACB7SQU1_HYAAI|nr:hypothetical protein HPB50_016967 [Hyalomma asiaticum]
MPKGVAKDAGGDSDKDALDVKDLRELVKAFENFKRDYRSDMRELKDSVSFCTDICNDVKGIAENIKQLRQEMHDIVNENKALKAENERLAQKCEELEQYQRLNNVEVKGVPVGDDPVLAMKKIGETVGEAIDEADLDTCHWTPPLEDHMRIRQDIVDVVSNPPPGMQIVPLESTPDSINALLMSPANTP